MRAKRAKDFNLKNLTDLAYKFQNSVRWDRLGAVRLGAVRVG